MNRTLNYSIKIEADEDGGYDVVVPALPGCATWGETYAQALTMARDALEGYIESLVAHDRPVHVEAKAVEGGFLVLGVTPHLKA